jgi:beta-glucosidase
MWGWASTAPQVEGAVKDFGRGPSIWDYAAHKFPGFIKNNDTLDIANNEFYLYKQEIQRLKALGIPYHSLSISWSRVLPFGNGTVNEDGLQHYVDKIDALLDAGIKPIVTLYHWDLPQALQDAYGGWLDPRIIDDFANYSRIVFKALAGKVNFWISLNEPQMFCQDYADWPALGIPDDVFPIHGVTDPYERKYKCGHHALLAHAHASRILHEEFGATNRISFANSWDYVVAASNSSADILARNRALDFTAGWMGNPTYIDGDYPPSMRSALGDLLPKFTEAEKNLVFNSTDFYAWDGYTGHLVGAAFDGDLAKCTRQTDTSWPVCADALYSLPKYGWPVGNKAGGSARDWLYDTPTLFRSGVLWSWNKFTPNAYFIPEIGFSEIGEAGYSIPDARWDDDRTNYLYGYLHEVLAMVYEDNVNLLGVIAWSATDNFEWRSGYETRFGLQYVDYKTQKRYYKKSAFFWKLFFNHYVSTT